MVRPGTGRGGPSVAASAGAELDYSSSHRRKVESNQIDLVQSKDEYDSELRKDLLSV